MGSWHLAGLPLVYRRGARPHRLFGGPILFDRVFWQRPTIPDHDACLCVIAGRCVHDLVGYHLGPYAAYAVPAGVAHYALAMGLVGEQWL